jgi:hypothetical protein
MTKLRVLVLSFPDFADIYLKLGSLTTQTSQQIPITQIYRLIDNLYMQKVG